MKPETNIILDVNYLAHRAYHVFGELEYKGKPTGVTFGILKEIQTLKELFQTDQFVFCFDYGKKSKRRQLFPGYKAIREKNKRIDEKSKIKTKTIHKEVALIRDKILPSLGYKNIFYEDGYEADDMIACALWNHEKNIVVSADKDLYQLVGKNTSMWNPSKKEMLTLEKFNEEYGITPNDWIMVKALAGCSTDEIPGVEGVGESKAIKFFTKEMNKETETYKKCWKFIKSEQYALNLKLVSLPLSGLKLTDDLCKIVKQNPIKRKKWNALVDKLGMKSFLKKQPNYKG